MGAEWFESLLVDYDVCSNWGNWNYAAGVGTDPRGFRYFNLLKRSQDYDPEGQYVKHWLPELAEFPAAAVHTPWAVPPLEQQWLGWQPGKTYPEPMVDLEQSAQENKQRYQATLAKNIAGR